jgi:hypothetical protein
MIGFLVFSILGPQAVPHYAVPHSHFSPPPPHLTSACNDSLNPSPSRENLPIPVPIPHLRGRFFPRHEPLGNGDPMGISVLDITRGFSLYSILDPNPMRNPYLIPDPNPTVAQPKATGLFYFFTNLTYKGSHKKTRMRDAIPYWTHKCLFFLLSARLSWIDGDWNGIEWIFDLHMI